MSANALYNDLSCYYDLMCSAIDYREQSAFAVRVHKLFGNGGNRCLDLACGTGPHVWHLLDAGFEVAGLDINQPMLDIAAERCPEAEFTCQDMAGFTVTMPPDLVTCFLYSIHYSRNPEALQACIDRVYAQLAPGGVFVFTSVDKTTITNTDCARHVAEQDGAVLRFESGWQYPGDGDRQALCVRIERQQGDDVQVWEDRHEMVAVSFTQLQAMLQSAGFEVHLFEHDFSRLLPWDGVSGNAIVVAVK